MRISACLAFFFFIVSALFGFFLIPREGPPKFEKYNPDLSIYDSVTNLRRASDYQPLPPLKPISEKKCLVTGSNGFLGSNLVEQLLEEDWHVIALHRKGGDLDILKGIKKDMKKGNLEFKEGDINDYKSLINAIPNGLDVVFHVAAKMSTWSPDNDNMYYVNVLGTKNVVNACLEKKVGKLVHTSTNGVFISNLRTVSVNEDSEYSARYTYHGYTFTKYCAEMEVKLGIKRGLWATVLNPASIFGKYDQTGFARVATLLLAGEIPGAGNSSISHNRAKEIAQAHIAAAHKGKLGENYILGGGHDTFRALIDEYGKNIRYDTSHIFDLPLIVGRIIGEVQEIIGKILNKQMPLTPEIIDISFQHFRCNSSKAERELGYVSNVPLAVSIKESSDWLIKTGKIKIK